MEVTVRQIPEEDVAPPCVCCLEVGAMWTPWTAPPNTPEFKCLSLGETETCKSPILPAEYEIIADVPVCGFHLHEAIDFQFAEGV